MFSPTTILVDKVKAKVNFKVRRIRTGDKQKEVYEEKRKKKKNKEEVKKKKRNGEEEIP